MSSERIQITEATPSSYLVEDRDLLEVEDLTVTFDTDDGPLEAVAEVNFTLRRGEVLAVVGESGSGKSVTALATMGLLPRSARIAGRILFEGRDLVPLDEKEMRSIRGNDIAMIFQDPMTALNPVFTIGDQIAEIIRAHDAEISKADAWSKVADLLALVGVPEPKRRAKQYPHEFSGGMRQRAMIAMAIANDPVLLIADEPTTALDVTIQAQVLEVMRTAQEATGAAMMLITHDLGLVAGSADRVQVMYAGRIFERGDVDEIFYESQNPYTLGLLSSIPSVGMRTDERLQPIPGSPPSLLRPPVGCPFRPRCKHAIDECRDGVPALVPLGMKEHVSRCIRTNDLEPGVLQ